MNKQYDLRFLEIVNRNHRKLHTDEKVTGKLDKALQVVDKIGMMTGILLVSVLVLRAIWTWLGVWLGW